MRLKLDENMPESLVDALKRLGHDVHTVREEQLQGAPDAEVFRAAQVEARLLVTQDLDFSDARQYPPGTHRGILLIRLVNPSRRMLHSYVEQLFVEQDARVWEGCFVVATDTKIRVRRP
jgi:predicted nuclease of predicted toxin-antitoxin system